MKNKNIEMLDVAVIGGGASGMFATFLCANRKLNVALFEGQKILGGQVSLLYAEKNIYNLPGMPCIKAKDFIKNLEQQVRGFDVPIYLEEKLLEIHPFENGSYRVITDKREVYAKAVVLAIGKGEFLANKLNVESEDSLAGRNKLHYVLNNIENFKDKEVVVFGGGDSAVDIALTINHVANQVHLVHRRAEFRATPSSVDALMHSTVNVHTPYLLDSIHMGQDGELNAISIESKDDGDNVQLNADHIFVNFGFKTKFDDNLKENLPMNRHHKIEVNQTLETEFKGVFAIGDICTYDKKQNNVNAGIAEATYLMPFLEEYIREN